MNNLIFLKLGGSLITDKSNTSTARPETIARLVTEIKAAREERPELKIVLGHGSGSFGHVSAKKYGTRQGVASPTEWQGFAEVWQQARALNTIMLDALHVGGLPAISFPVSAAAITENGTVKNWDIRPIKYALEHNLLPLVYGDVVFDETLGGTILSTEDIFVHLASQLKPKRILLAGIELGVWQDYPANTQLIQEINSGNFDQISMTIAGSANTDVTGGMAAKVAETLALVQRFPTLSALIFSGEEPDSVKNALLGQSPGTEIRN